MIENIFRLSGAALLAIATACAQAQDVAMVLKNAEDTMGRVQSIRYSATGTMGGFGQNWSPDTGWHTTVVQSYTRTLDYAAKSSREEMTRTQEAPPAKGGETPFQGEQKLVNLVRGSHAWNQPGKEAVPRPSDAGERQLQIWLTPHGFLQAAAEHGVQVSQKDGATTLSFQMDKHRVTGDLDDNGQLTRVTTWIANPVLGDMPVVTHYGAYKGFDGIRFPTHIRQEQGGWMTLELDVSSVQTHVAGAAPEVPDAVRSATVAAANIRPTQLADGVWFLAGGSHNAVLVEFKDHVAVVEAPVSEAFSNAVIEAVDRLVPGKPIRYVVNTHHHFDHSAGLRTYVAEGATVVTHAGNRAFYESAWSQPRTLAADRLSQFPREARFETFTDRHTLTDGNQTLEVHHARDGDHNAFMALVYLPRDGILIEADLFTPPAADGPGLVPIALGFASNLHANLQRLQIEPTTIAPLHGRVVPFSELAKALNMR